MLLLCAACVVGVDDDALPEDDDTADVVDDDGGAEDEDRADDDSAVDDPTPAPPCAAYAKPIEVGEVDDEDLTELSGLVVSQLNPGIFWSHEDSGGPADLVALDSTGATVSTLHVLDVENEDWEDLALAPCEDGWCLWIGDIGDRGTDRTEFSLAVVREPTLNGRTELEVDAKVLPFTYPGEAENAESLVVRPDGIPVVITKRRDATAGVYELPTGTDQLTWLADIVTGEPGQDLTARATGASLWPDGRRLLLRTYFHLYEFDASAGFASLGPPVEVLGAVEPQGEAVAYDPVAGGFWQVSEWAHPRLHWVGCAEDVETVQ